MPTDAMPTSAPPTPIAERPAIPPEYGVPATAEGLLDWAPIADRLAAAKVYWIATSGPGGVPRIRPVDGLFVDGVLYVGGSPKTRWVRDLEANPMVSVHLDDGSDVVILEGEAELLPGVAPEHAHRLAAASNEKYPQYGMTEAHYSGPGPFAIRPRVAFAWSSFPRDVTRFRFEPGREG